MHFSHDERILACLISLAVPIQAQEWLAVLDQQKETGKTLSDTAYADILKNYKEWIKECNKPFTDGPFVKDVQASFGYFQRCRCKKSQNKDCCFQS
jgi:uncharacterized protein YaaR (DUF327 family)